MELALVPWPVRESQRHEGVVAQLGVQELPLPQAVRPGPFRFLLASVSEQENLQVSPRVAGLEGRSAWRHHCSPAGVRWHTPYF